MWLVCVDTPYYPYMFGFNTYEEALKKYKEILEDREIKDEAIYLVNIDKKTIGPEYYNAKHMFND